VVARCLPCRRSKESLSFNGMHKHFAAAMPVVVILLVPGTSQVPKAACFPRQPFRLQSGLDPTPTRVADKPQNRAVKYQVITHGLRTARKVALTFDACSTRRPSEYDERVTQVLLESKTAATIFLGGKWIREEKEHARYIASFPQFELGNHSDSHPHLTKVSDSQIRDELRKTQEELRKITRRTTTLFRPPYGEYDQRVVNLATEMGLTTIEYDLPSGDPAKSATKEKLVEYVTSMVKNGSIVVMHINRRGWHTAEALPQIISNLRKRGFQFVTVGDLLRDLDRANEPQPGRAAH
jgi:peptidoglycan/xylan/chitin deacetylase (PgdA/CDA1 family)